MCPTSPKKKDAVIAASLVFFHQRLMRVGDFMLCRRLGGNIVAHVPATHPENDVFGDVGRVIGDPPEISRNQ